MKLLEATEEFVASSLKTNVLFLEDNLYNDIFNKMSNKISISFFYTTIVIIENVPQISGLHCKGLLPKTSFCH